jgi:hypothetical protein
MGLAHRKAFKALIYFNTILTYKAKCSFYFLGSFQNKIKNCPKKITHLFIGTNGINIQNSI